MDYRERKYYRVAFEKKEHNNIMPQIKARINTAKIKDKDATGCMVIMIVSCRFDEDQKLNDFFNEILRNITPHIFIRQITKENYGQ